MSMTVGTQLKKSPEPQFNDGLIEKGMSLILQGLGVNLQDPNFIDTPERYARALREMFVPKTVEYATFKEDYADFVLLRGHKMHSLCPHHMYPVRFFVSLAYIPDGRVLGLSKLARLLDECNRGPLLQERFTRDVLTLLQQNVPGVKGAACLIQGKHGCMEIRGVKSEAELFTYRVEGVFDTDSKLQQRFFFLTGVK